MHSYFTVISLHWVGSVSNVLVVQNAKSGNQEHNKMMEEIKMIASPEISIMSRSGDFTLIDYTKNEYIPVYNGLLKSCNDYDTDGIEYCSTANNPYGQPFVNSYSFDAIPGQQQVVFTVSLRISQVIPNLDPSSDYTIEIQMEQMDHKIVEPNEGIVEDMGFAKTVRFHMSGQQILNSSSSGILALTMIVFLDPLPPGMVHEPSMVSNINITQTIINTNIPIAKRDESPYSYGWNQQSRTDEVAGSGNHYTAPFWEYSPRTVHRWNLDPKPNPSISPYAIMQGNPIWFSDHLGDTIRISYTAGENKQLQTMTYTPGMKYEGENKFLSQTIGDLNTLNSKNKGGEMVGYLSSISDDVSIMQSVTGNKADGFNVGFDISQAFGGLNENGGTKRPSFIDLGHELAHVWDHSLGTIDKGTWFKSGNGKIITNAEKFATHIENQIRAEHSLPLRTHYDSRGTFQSRILNGSNRSLFYNTTTKIKLMNPDGGLWDDGQNRTIIQGTHTQSFKY